MTQLLKSLVAASILALALAGCSAQPESTEKPLDTVELIGALDGVVAVESHSEALTVIVGATESDEVVLDAARKIQQIALDTEWAASIDLNREPLDDYDEDLDVGLPAPLRLQLVPGGEEQLERLAQLLALEKLPSSASVTVLGGWPYVSLESVETFASSFRTLAATALFERGGTVSLVGSDRLRIVWVPQRTSLEAIDAIVAISADFPDAEVLLQATTEGPQWPTLYVARVSAEDAAAIEQRLLDPSLSGADVEGYGLPYILTVIGESGPVYLEGNLGGVVE